MKITQSLSEWKKCVAVVGVIQVLPRIMNVAIQHAQSATIVIHTITYALNVEIVSYIAIAKVVAQEETTIKKLVQDVMEQDIHADIILTAHQ